MYIITLPNALIPSGYAYIDSQKDLTTIFAISGRIWTVTRHVTLLSTFEATTFKANHTKYYNVFIHTYTPTHITHPLKHYITSQTGPFQPNNNLLNLPYMAHMTIGKIYSISTSSATIF